MQTPNAELRTFRATVTRKILFLVFSDKKWSFEIQISKSLSKKNKFYFFQHNRILQGMHASIFELRHLSNAQFSNG